MQPLAPDEVPILLSLMPPLQRLALAHRAACLAQGVPFHFRSGYRSTGYQQILYGHPELHPGTPAAKPGSSKHERAAAYDADHGNDLQTVIFGAEAEKLGLVWGGRFQRHADGSGGPDYPHCELPNSLLDLDAYLEIRAAGLLA